MRRCKVGALQFVPVKLSTTFATFVLVVSDSIRNHSCRALPGLCHIVLLLLRMPVMENPTRLYPLTDPMYYVIPQGT
jgi:hypothetical protein